MSLVVNSLPQRSLGSFLGGTIGAIGGFVTGGIGGAVAGANAGAAVGRAIEGSSPTPRSTPPIGSTGGGFIGYGVGGGVTQTGKPACGIGDFMGALSGTCAPFGFGATPTSSMGCMKGYHWNKHTYYTKSGVVPAHSKMVRNRHMNPTNIRALRRADRRAHGFLRIARRVVKHYVAKAPKGKAYIAAHRRRK